MNKNYKIRQISVPEFDEDGKETGMNILLEVVSIEKLKAVVNTADGGILTKEELCIVCFEAKEPKKLRIISADSDLITVIKYERYDKNNEFRGNRSTHRRKN